MVRIVSLCMAAGLLTACGLDARAQQTFDNPCDRATDMVARCGATLPFISGRSCTGLARLTAMCITQHASDCDTLATLAGRLEDCMPDAGDDLFPTAEDIEMPVARRDAGIGARP